MDSMSLLGPARHARDEHQFLSGSKSATRAGIARCRREYLAKRRVAAPAPGETSPPRAASSRSQFCYDVPLPGPCIQVESSVCSTKSSYSWEWAVRDAKAGGVDPHATFRCDTIRMRSSGAGARERRSTRGQQAVHRAHPGVSHPSRACTAARQAFYRQEETVAEIIERSGLGGACVVPRARPGRRLPTEAHDRHRDQLRNPRGRDRPRASFVEDGAQRNQPDGAQDPRGRDGPPIFQPRRRRRARHRCSRSDTRWTSTPHPARDAPAILAGRCSWCSRSPTYHCRDSIVKALEAGIAYTRAAAGELGTGRTRSESGCPSSRSTERPWVASPTTRPDTRGFRRGARGGEEDSAARRQ